MITPEFIAAEVAYRTERLSPHNHGVRRPARRLRSLRSLLTLPVLRRRQQVRLRTLASR